MFRRDDLRPLAVRTAGAFEFCLRLSVAQAFLPVPQVTTTRSHAAGQTRAIVLFSSFLFAVPYVVPLLNDCHPERKEGSAVRLRLTYRWPPAGAFGPALVSSPL
jgi:hypothetical protein